MPYRVKQLRIVVLSRAATRVFKIYSSSTVSIFLLHRLHCNTSTSPPPWSCTVHINKISQRDAGTDNFNTQREVRTEVNSNQNAQNILYKLPHKLPAQQLV